MNYQALVETKWAKGIATLYGFMKKIECGNKYLNVITLDKKFADNVLFIADMAVETETMVKIAHKNLFHYILTDDDAAEEGASSKKDKLMQLESGTMTTLAYLLNNQPDIVAKKGFLDNLFEQLCIAASILHEQGIYHVCFSPDNIFMRGSTTAGLLIQGSFYLNLNQKQLYEGHENYVAAEVLEHGEADARSDIYGIGRLMEFVCLKANMPYEYRKVVKKATRDDPDRRYQTIEDMKSAKQRAQRAKNSFLTLIAAIIVAAIIIGVVKMMLPEPTAIQYVDPKPKQITDELYDNGFTPDELGVVTGDSIAKLSPEELEKQKEYETKAEQIFRKRYTKAAESIISQIYNKSNMAKTQENFMAGSQESLRQLTEIQQQLGEEAQLSTEKSQRIASEIIGEITEKKMEEMR